MGVGAVAMSGRLLALACLAVSLATAGDDLALAQAETIKRTFPAAKNLDVDNFDGAVTVTGANVRDIEIEVHKTIRARSAEKIEEAKREVRLDMEERGDGVRLYVDGPFRCRCGDGSINYRGSHYYGYEVSFDFTVKAPRETNLRLRAVNHGDIRVENTAGAFDVENINGGIDLIEVAGSGHAYALNRPLNVGFSSNPKDKSDFGSLNGTVEVTFRPGLSADVWLKTFNGEAYTDFDVSMLPARPAASVQRNGKYVYKSHEYHGVRVGNGGPELSFNTLNGDILIRKRGN